MILKFEEKLLLEVVKKFSPLILNESYTVLVNF